MRKLKTEIIALADYAVIAQDNKVSIMGIFDELKVEKFPSGFIGKYFVATLAGEPGESYHLNIKLERGDSNHNLLNPMLITAKMSPNGKHNMIITLQQVGFEKDGDYHFRIYHGNEVVGSTRLQVIDLKKEKERAIN